MPSALNKEEFIKRSVLAHNNKYDYENVVYINQYDPVIINCPIHGDFKQIPKSHMIGHGCKKCMSDNFKNKYTGTNKVNKLDTNLVINKLKEAYKEYDYSNSYITGSRETAIIHDIKCRTHGFFTKRLTNHLRQNQGCNLCGSNKLSNYDFISRSNIIHQNKYNYSLSDYINNKTKLKIICPKHGEFMQSPLKHLSGQGCPICAEDKKSKGEAFIRKFLIANNIEYDQEKIIPGTKLRMDFYLPIYNICIEYDGIQHFKYRDKFGGEDAYKLTMERDIRKNKYCKENNIKMFRIPYTNYNKLNIILLDILNIKELKYLENFNSFNYSNFVDKDILYIFDFDDTIVNSPRFEELAIEHLKENHTIESLLKKSLKYIHKDIKDIKIENGRLYINDPSEEIEINGNWVRKKKRIYLVAPDNFYFSELSLPKTKTKLAELYNKVDNKAIVTGRTESLRSKVEKSLNDLKLDTPKHGLYCFPSKDESGDRVPIWKGNTIVKLIRKTGFKKVKFYDDNSKWVNKVTKIVKENLPDIEFEGIKFRKY